MIHLLHRGLDMTTRGMEGSHLGIGIISQLVYQIPGWNGPIVLIVVRYLIVSSKNSFGIRTNDHVRHHPHLPGQGNQ